MTGRIDLLILLSFVMLILCFTAVYAQLLSGYGGAGPGGMRLPSSPELRWVLGIVAWRHLQFRLSRRCGPSVTDLECRERSPFSLRSLRSLLSHYRSSVRYFDGPASSISVSSGFRAVVGMVQKGG
jgi:hypothetical protein